MCSMAASEQQHQLLVRRVDPLQKKVKQDNEQNLQGLSRQFDLILLEQSIVFPSNCHANADSINCYRPTGIHLPPQFLDP